MTVVFKVDAIRARGPGRYWQRRAERLAASERRRGEAVAFMTMQMPGTYEKIYMDVKVG